MMNSKRNRNILLTCALMCGLWAGSIVTYVTTCNAFDVRNTADMKFQARPRLFNQGEATPRTKPYTPETAPQFNFPLPLSPLDLLPAPAPEVAPVAPVAPAPEVAPAPSELDGLFGDNRISDIFGYAQRLFAGDGSFKDILDIALFALSVYGGYNIGSSDMLFKLVLGLFSGKGNYDQIIEDKVTARRPLLARRRKAVIGKRRK